MTAAELRRMLPAGLKYRLLESGGYRRAAVLVPLEPGAGVWLTRRSAALSDHAGQVSFPGGKIEAFDASAEAAALREASEEIGLLPEASEILGRMNDYVTGTGFHMVPVLALVRPGVTFLPAAEVQDVFCLDFKTLLDPAAPQWRQAEILGRTRQFWVWPHDQHIIWGATAAILVNLARLLRGDP